MSDLFSLSEYQMAWISPYFPLSHGVARVDDRCVNSGIVYVIKHGLRWKDAPVGYDPHKTLYNRFIRWSRMGVFDRNIKAGIPSQKGRTVTICFDKTIYKLRYKIENLIPKLKFIIRVA